MASTETKVGLLVVAGLGALGWLSINSGLLGAAVQPNMRELSSTFSDVDGLSPGADVKMAGVTIGQVSDIRLTEAGGAQVVFTVRDNVPLSNGAQALITSNGLIGEKFLELSPGGGNQPLPETATTITAGGTVAVDDIAGNFAKVSDDLEAITSTLRSVLGGPDQAQKLANIMNNFEGFSAKLDTLLNNEIQEGQIGTIITNLEEATTSLNTMLAGGNEQNTAEMIANFGTTAKNLAAITERLNNGEGMLGQMMQGGTSLDGQTGNMMADLQAAASELREITAKINSGEGTLARLINDEDMADQLSETLDSFAGTASRIEQFATEVDLGYQSLVAESGIGKGRFDVTVAPNDKRYYRLGVMTDGFANEADSTEGVNRYTGVNFGEQTKFTAQFGFIMPDTVFNERLGVRIGMKDSTAGVGLDTKLHNPLGGTLLSEKIDINADLYDFSGENTGDSDVPHLDFTAKMGVNVLGQTNTYATFGYDNVLSEDYGSPFIGIGIRFQDDDLKYLVGSAL